MTRKRTFDESSFHLRWGFRVGAAIVAVCVAALLMQDAFPSASRLPAAGVVAAAAAGPAGVGTLAPLPGRVANP